MKPVGSEQFNEWTLLKIYIQSVALHLLSEDWESAFLIFLSRARDMCDIKNVNFY